MALVGADEPHGRAALQGLRQEPIEEVLMGMDPDIFAAALAKAWDEGYEAGCEAEQDANGWGTSGPHKNPYRRTEP